MTITIEFIRSEIDSESYKISLHADNERLNDELSVTQLEQALMNGEIIEYNNCFYCGGAVKETITSREIWWQGHLYIFEKVPMGVCSQCGEKVLKPRVAKAIDFCLAEKIVPDKFILTVMRNCAIFNLKSLTMCFLNQLFGKVLADSLLNYL